MSWNYALVFSYGLPVAGREAKALEAFADGQVLFGKYAADGMCAEPEAFQKPFGGGMMIIRADGYEKLFDMLETDDAKHLIEVCAFAVQDFEFTFMHTGTLLMEDMGLYATVGTELGYL
ncbi:MAG: hypothetical protein HKN80_15185 [Acidimicrobiia bacterium]|nr:hypothetical protein [Acidimicrobiia bacterium]